MIDVIDGGRGRGEDMLRRLVGACKKAKWIWTIVLGSATWSTMRVSEDWLWASDLCVGLHVVRTLVVPDELLYTIYFVLTSSCVFDLMRAVFCALIFWRCETNGDYLPKSLSRSLCCRPHI